MPVVRTATALTFKTSSISIMEQCPPLKPQL